MPKISVVIPVYNVKLYLEKCLESILNQTFRDIEVLLVDDGSTDGSGELCDRIAATDRRIRCIHKENGGVASARNAGIALMNGEYLTFVDSDDWLDSETCQVAAELADTHRLDVLMWSYVREYPERSLKKNLGLREGLYEGSEVRDRIRRRMVGLLGPELVHPESADALSPCWGKLYRASLFEDRQVQFRDQELIGPTEDALFNLELFSRVGRFYYIDRPFYHYKKTSNTSITTSYKDWLFDRWQTLFKIMEGVISGEELGEAYSAALNNRICLSMVGLGLNEISPNNPKSRSEKIRFLKSVLSEPHYRDALRHLQYKYLPFYWSVFFRFCRWRFGPGIYGLLNAMRYAQSRM